MGDGRMMASMLAEELRAVRELTLVCFAEQRVEGLVLSGAQQDTC